MSFSKIICVPEMSSVCCTVTGKSMNSIDLLQMDPKISKFILPNLLLFTGLHSMCFICLFAFRNINLMKRLIFEILSSSTEFNYASIRYK